MGKSFCCHVCKQFLLMLCTMIGAIILSINIQLGLDMYPYDDIGDASSSLWGSTSSIFLFQRWIVSNYSKNLLIFTVWIIFFFCTLQPKIGSFCLPTCNRDAHNFFWWYLLKLKSKLLALRRKYAALGSKWLVVIIGYKVSITTYLRACGCSRFVGQQSSRTNCRQSCPVW